MTDDMRIKTVRPRDGIVRPSVIDNSLFLVGPTPRSPDALSWRPEAMDILAQLDYCGIVYVPEPFHGSYVEQIHWETSHLTYCNVIAAWVPRDMATMPGLTTNIEFGEWFHNPKFVYGRPDDAPHCRYLDERYKYRDSTITGTSEETQSRFGNKPHTSLRSLLEAVVRNGL